MGPLLTATFHGTLHGITFLKIISAGLICAAPYVTLLLRYEADPFATQLCTLKSIAFDIEVWALAKAKRKEARRYGSERRSMEKVDAVENTALADDKMESTKPLFRFRLLLGEGGRKHLRLTSG
jgi:hypothetical protein